MEDGEIEKKLPTCWDKPVVLPGLTNAFGVGMQRSRLAHHLKR